MSLSTESARRYSLALFVLMVLAPVARPQLKSDPLTKAEILDLLRNYVAPARVASLVREKGVDFNLSAADEQELRSAGASAALIDALHEMGPKLRITKPGETRVNAKDGQEYVWIPPGTFSMGCSPDDDGCYGDEKPRHSVRITKGFWMGKTPVTVKAGRRFGLAGKNGEEFDELPVITARWAEAQGFCNAAGMRLPTEAEWEYAARAGVEANRYGDLDSIAWYEGNGGRGVHPVGLKQPNAWGLYDMFGNLPQWTADWFDENYYALSPSSDPPGPSSGDHRVVRGSEYNDTARKVRASYRTMRDPELLSYGTSFRCVGGLT